MLDGGSNSTPQKTTAATPAEVVPHNTNAAANSVALAKANAAAYQRKLANQRAAAQQAAADKAADAAAAASAAAATANAKKLADERAFAAAEQAKAAAAAVVQQQAAQRAANNQAASDKAADANAAAAATAAANTLSQQRAGERDSAAASTAMTDSRAPSDTAAAAAATAQGTSLDATKQILDTAVANKAAANGVAPSDQALAAQVSSMPTVVISPTNTGASTESGPYVPTYTPGAGGTTGTTGSNAYTVVSGDTLSAIAQRNGTDYQTLAKLNGIDNPNLIHAGQSIKLPAGASSTDSASPYVPTSVPTPTGTTRNAYTVVSGDTLSAIAQRNGTDYQTLAKLNGISNPNVIHPGQSIELPGSSMGGGVAGISNDSAGASTPINLTGFSKPQP